VEGRIPFYPPPLKRIWGFKESGEISTMNYGIVHINNDICNRIMCREFCEYAGLPDGRRIWFVEGKI
jgi:hypothetical protein